MGQPQACTYSPGILGWLRLLQFCIVLGCGCWAWGGGLLSTQARPPFVGSPTTCAPPARKLLLHPPILTPYIDFNPFSSFLVTSPTGVSLFPPTLCAPVLSSSPPSISSTLPSLGPIPPAVVAGLFFLLRPLWPSPWPSPCPPSNLFFLPL